MNGGGGKDTEANEATDAYATIGGGWGNVAGNGAAGGGENATVGGGADNAAGNSHATVGGGESNTAGASHATVGGGYANTADVYAAVAGGHTNTASGSYAAIGGGLNNEASAMNTAVGRGASNRATELYAAVGGGYANTAGGYAAVAGGQGNAAGGSYAAVGGGASNVAGGARATIPGGYRNRADGEYSFAAGRRAKARPEDAGTFVWADSQDADFASTAADQFSFRCQGGVRFASGAGGDNQQVAWTPGDASWSFSSDRNLKEGFTAVDAREILQKLARLAVTQWNYKGHAQKHIGPTAQDFFKAFGLGGSKTMIDGADLDGVALAAIQGLYGLLQEKDTEIGDLKQRIERLEKLVQMLLNLRAEAGGKHPDEAERGSENGRG